MDRGPRRGQSMRTAEHVTTRVFTSRHGHDSRVYVLVLDAKLDGGAHCFHSVASYLDWPFYAPNVAVVPEVTASSPVLDPKSTSLDPQTTR